MVSVKVVIVLVLLAAWVELPESKQLVVYPSSWKCEVDALEDEGFVVDTCETADMDKDEFYVVHGGACKVVSQDPHLRMSYLETITCQYGRWTTGGTDSALESQGQQQVVVKKPPEYMTCPPSDIRSEYFVPEGQEEMTIDWTKPDAKDSDGSIKSNQQVAGITNGGSFAGSSRPGGRQHTILYEAKDDDGMTAFCYFSFTVKVRSCGALHWPPNGHRDCTNDNILGSTCKISCNDGYNPVNNISETTCTGDKVPQWSAEPSCEKISCNTPPDITDGTVTCSSGHEFGDYCVASCFEGYTLQGQVYSRCEADGNWFWGVPTTCTDSIAPELTCKTPQIFYADEGFSSVAVQWETPSVTDNLDNALTAKQTSGPDQGVVIEAGNSDYVTYVATDTAGNQSPSCNIELRAEAIFCSHPLNAMEDARLRFDCTTNPQYIYGDTCTLTCALNLPLEGTNLITCKHNNTGTGPPVGYWDWGSEDMPYCRDIACPEINPPRNGAFVFDWVAARPTSTMMCNENWDIPDLGSGFNGMFICRDSGLWNPAYETAPGCTETFSARGYLLPSEFFYYGGVCGVNDTILENFADILDDLSNFFEALCPVGTVCEPMNPKVTCGEYGSRKRSARRGNSRRRRKRRLINKKFDRFHVLKKRQTSGPVLIFSFDIAAFFDTSQMTKVEQWDHADNVHFDVLRPEILSRVEAGTYNRPNWDPLTSSSFQTANYGDPYCDPGSVVAQVTKCSKCPGGHYELNGVCMKCPIGEFSDSLGSVACTQCPVGFSTRQDVSDTLANCTQLCTPGTYSPDTFVPCAKCKAGTYQPDTGQTQCLTCPVGTSTKSAGSMLASDCQAFDAIVTDTGGYGLTMGIPLLTNLGLEFFLKVVSGTPNIVISVDGELDVAIAETISVSTASTSDDLGEPSFDAWIHVSISWDVASGEFKAFYRDSLVTSHSSIFPTVTPLVQDGHMTISASGDAVLMISGLRLHEALIAGVDNVTATTCQNMDSDDVVNMEHLKYLENITMLVPSVCDVVDECLSSPCGQHSRKCANNVGGFTCICKDGWTGVTCDTPPDYCLHANCQNGATCLNGLTNYTCNCEPGYSGVNCEKQPVNGDWSIWTTWAECSATCNTGSRERTRSCDSPARDLYGQDCVGVDVETEDCNTSPCLECPDIQRGDAAVPICNEDAVTGTKTCIAACVDGHVRPSGLDNNETFTCGIETDYKWQPRQNIPACIKANRPERYTFSASASFDQTVPRSDKQDVINGITSNLASTQCFGSAPHCSADVQLGSSGRRRKRNTGTSVEITFTITLTDTSALQLYLLEQNGTISPALQEIIDAINNLEATAVAINDSASTYFDVTTNGVTYTVDTNTVTFDGAAICSEGQVVTGGVCAECPAGSYQVGDYCSLCDKGTYQDQTGQSSCVQCPYGYTTITVGSDSSTDCSVLESTSSSATTSTLASGSTIRRPLEDDKSDGGIFIIVSIVVTVLAVLIIGVIVCLMKHKAARTKIADSTADLRGMDNPVYSMPTQTKFSAKPWSLSSRPPSTLTVRDLDLGIDPIIDNRSSSDNKLYN